MTTNPRVDIEAANVRSEIYSANTQASIVLATIAIAAGPIASRVSSLTRQPWPVVTLAVAGGVAGAGAALFLLNVVLPRLDRSGRGSFLHWAELDPDSLRAALDEDYQIDELLVLSRIATAKYRSLRKAGHLLKVALATAAVVALLNLFH